MAQPRFEADLNIISKLDDEPNDVGSLTAAELKERFDRAGKLIQDYLNNTLLPGLEALGVEETVRGDDQVRHLRLNGDRVLETSPDGRDWQATGSSGHLIQDAHGATLPQRSRLRFAQGAVRDENGVTVVEGVTGPQGQPGPAGPRGPVGETGPMGPAIVPTVDSQGVMHFALQATAIPPESVSVRGPQGVQGVQGQQGAPGVRGPQGIQGVQGLQGPRGLQGEAGSPGPAGPQGEAGVQGPMGPQGRAGAPGKDGTSLYVEDVYPTLPALRQALPGGDRNLYLVEADGCCYLWSERKGDWVSAGPLSGPAGPQGPAGAQGVQGPAGPQGPRGAAGAPGLQGAEGPQGAIGPSGPQGPAGVSGKDGKSPYQTAVEGGYSGTETAFNQALSTLPVHAADDVRHITAAERSAWNGKADSAQLAAKADASALTAHTGAAELHVTAADKKRWDGKLGEVPLASAQVLGGVKPVTKTAAMTSPVGVDSLGQLFAASGGAKAVFGSYAGNGAKSKKLTFAGKPLFFAATDNRYDMIITPFPTSQSGGGWNKEVVFWWQGITNIQPQLNDRGKIHAEGNTLSWTSDVGTVANHTERSYFWFAILEG